MGEIDTAEAANTGEGSSAFEGVCKIPTKDALQNFVGDRRNLVRPCRDCRPSKNGVDTDTQHTTALECERRHLALLNNERAEHVNAPQGTRQRTGGCIRPQFCDGVDSLIIGKSAQPLNNLRVRMFSHTRQECSGRLVCDPGQDRRVVTADMNVEGLVRALHRPEWSADTRIITHMSSVCGGQKGCDSDWLGST